MIRKAGGDVLSEVGSGRALECAARRPGAKVHAQHANPATPGGASAILPERLKPSARFFVAVLGPDTVMVTIALKVS